MSDKDQAVSFSRFACIGAGLSAIALGATLKRWYSITDIHFFERQRDLGGTWYANSYPENLAYLRKVANDHDLPSKMTFGADVEHCEWQQDSHRWRLRIRNVADGSVLLHECQFLFSAVGLLANPREPDLPGLDNFEGPVFHAARWRHNVDLRGKRVAVIGNGCSAAQLVPSIVDETQHLTQYARSKHWIAPPIRFPASDETRQILNRIPGIMFLSRLITFCNLESDYPAYLFNYGAKLRARFAAQFADYVRKTAPQKYHDLLIPDFEVGCKRRIYDAGYLRALHKSNLTLTMDPIVEALPNAIRTKSGHVNDTDVIVFASGFAAQKFLPGTQIIGRDGLDLHEHWASYGGPEAYNTVAVHGFPNFFMLLGPNTVTGNMSVTVAAENGVNHALRVIKPILDGDATDVMITREAEKQYSQQMQQALQRTVYASSCGSWYNKPNPDGTVWNGLTWPYSQAYYWYRSLFPVSRDWSYTMTPGATRRRFLRKTLKTALWSALLASAIKLVAAANDTPSSPRDVFSLLSRSWHALTQRFLASVP